VEPKVLSNYINYFIYYIFIQIGIICYLILLENILRFRRKYFLISMFFIFTLTKIITQRNHLLNYLILIEVYIVMIYFFLSYNYILFSSSVVTTFFFIVIMVCGASLGISLLVIITRSMNKEIEIVHRIFRLN